MISRRKHLAFLLGSLSGSMGASAWGDQTMRFRLHQGNYPNIQLPETWSERDYEWTFRLSTGDVSTPSIYAGQLFLLHSVPDRSQITLTALDVESGDQNWSLSRKQVPSRLHRRNSFAASTPAADEDGVIITYSDDRRLNVVAVSPLGGVIWERDLGDFQSSHGFGASPSIHDGLCVLMVDQQSDELEPGEKPGESFVFALDRATGETRWKTSIGSKRTSYGTAVPFRGQWVLANTREGIFAVSHDDGRILWRCPELAMRSCSTPLILEGTSRGDLAIATSGSGGGGGNHLVACKIPGLAELDRGSPVPSLASDYRIERQVAYVPTCAVIDDRRILMISDRGIATIFESSTGEVLWTKRLGGNHGASPIVVGKRGLAISLSGEVTIIDVGSSKPQVINQFSLGGGVAASPIVVGNRLIVRIDRRLVALPLA
ncbi:MAG: PQQ-binding-like beta-propeller repeat protein [Planctomycetota bacterium]